MYLDPNTQSINEAANRNLLENSGMSTAYAQPLAAAITTASPLFRLLFEDAIYARKWVSEGVSFADIILRLSA